RAVHRLVGARLERHLGRLAALRADGREHLARRAAVAAATAVATTATAAAVAAVAAVAVGALRLAGGPTLGAAAGLVGVALLDEELLLTLGEGEGFPAISAGESLVDVNHVCLPWG